VYIVFSIAWHVVVDDQWNIVHINATRDNIGGYEDIHLVVTEV
jgi:hypothetical protein